MHENFLCSWKQISVDTNICEACAIKKVCSPFSTFVVPLVNWSLFLRECHCGPQCNSVRKWTILTQPAWNSAGSDVAVFNENGTLEPYLSYPQSSRHENEAYGSAGFFPNFLAYKRSRAICMHNVVNPSEFSGKGGPLHKPTNIIHLSIKISTNTVSSAILSIEIFKICADSGIFQRLLTYFKGWYMRISLLMFTILMVTGTDIEFNRHVDVIEQVCNKVNWSDSLPRKQEDVCYWSQHCYG